MRDPARIDVVLQALMETWKRQPDLRLGQLIDNVTYNAGDLFYIEDDYMVELLKEYNRN